MIPDTFHGLPVHALAVHGAVVFVPLAALMAIMFVIPRTRSWAAWPMLIVTIVAMGNIYVARESGYNLKNDLEKFNPTIAGTIKNHEDKANVLFYLMIAFTVLVVAVFLLYRRRGSFVGTVRYVACALLVVGAVAVGYQVIETGEAGAKAVWGATVQSAPVMHPTG